MSISKQIESVLSNARANKEFQEQLEKGKEFSEQMRNMGLLKQPQEVMPDPHSMGIDRLKKIYAAIFSIDTPQKPN